MVPRNSTCFLSWICSVYADPAQPLTVAEEDLDDDLLWIDRQTDR